MQMLYACPNVKTTTYGAKINQPPMKAFRAPGFVEGTFGLESLLDELAAKLDLDPLELRRLNYARHDASDDRPYSSKNLLECYRRAEPHWERRHEVRARSTDTVKRGVGMASQIWYGGGGPPSYAWVRVGSDGHATVSPRCRTSAPARRRRWRRSQPKSSASRSSTSPSSLGDSARGPYAAISAGSSTTPSMGPAVRAAAADAKQQIQEIASSAATPEARSPRSSHCSRTPDPRQGRPRAEPDGHAGADVRRPGRGGRRRHRDRRGVGRPHRGGPRRRPRDQPARSLEPDRGRDHPGHRTHAVRGTPPRSADGRDPHTSLDAYKLPTIADVPGDRQRADRRARRAPDEPRLEGPRRTADHPDSRGDRERDPRRNGRRRAPAADHTRGDAACAARGRARRREREKVGAPAGV